MLLLLIWKYKFSQSSATFDDLGIIVINEDTKISLELQFTTTTVD